MYVHLQRKLLLATCIALAACQSTGERAAATLSVAAAAPAAIEAARLLGTDGFDRVELDGRGLRLLDPQGQVRANLPGRFEGLDQNLLCQRERTL